MGWSPRWDWWRSKLREMPACSASAGAHTAAHSPVTTAMLVLSSWTRRLRCHLRPRFCFCLLYHWFVMFRCSHGRAAAGSSSFFFGRLYQFWGCGSTELWLDLVNLRCARHVWFLH